jgi:hypothetical protein
MSNQQDLSFYDQET